MKGTGLTDEEIYRPFIGVCNSYSNFFPDHSNLDKIGQAVKDGILMGGGAPVEFSTIGVYNGMIMGTDGMKYSLPAVSLLQTALKLWQRRTFAMLLCWCVHAIRLFPV